MLSTNGVEELFSDIQILKPSILIAPSRIWTGLYSLYFQKLQSSENQKQEEVKEWLKNLVGDRISVLATGGSPTSQRVMDWVKQIWTEQSFSESYGCTEVGGILCSSDSIFF